MGEPGRPQTVSAAVLAVVAHLPISAPRLSPVMIGASFSKWSARFVATLTMA